MVISTSVREAEEKEGVEEDLPDLNLLSNLLSFKGLAVWGVDVLELDSPSKKDVPVGLVYESAVDDLATPCVRLPPAYIVLELPKVLDKALGELESTSSDTLFSAPSKSRASIPLADFPFADMAPIVDSNVDLLTGDKGK